MKRLFPFLKWFPVTRFSLKADLLAGITVAMILVPQAMAYAELAGLPPWVGLYSAFLPPIIAVMWGSSSHKQTGPVALSSLITATTLSAIAAPGSTGYIRLAVNMAFIVGVIFILVAAFKLTFIANFISRPVIDGFIHAGALLIAASQLGKLLGLPSRGGASRSLAELANLTAMLPDAHIPTLAMGLFSLFIIMALGRARPAFPAALFVTIAATCVSYLYDLSDFGRVHGAITAVGNVPRDLPLPVMPVPDLDTAIRLLPGAAAIAFVGFMEMCSVVKAIAAKNRDTVDLRQESLGQGLGNMASAVCGGYTVSASLSRTALSYACGAKTGLHAVFTGLTVLLVLLFLTPLLQHIPVAVLSAIIIAAVVKLIEPRKFADYWKFSRADAVVGAATFAGTIALSPHMERGILLGIVLSIAMYLYRTMQPRVVLLGLRADGKLRDAARYGLEINGEMPVLRFDGRLYFANTAYFEESVLNTSAAYPKAGHIAVSCEGINAMDASGAAMLGELTDRLREQNVALILFDMRKQVYDALERSGLVSRIGREHVLRTYDEALRHAGKQSS